MEIRDIYRERERGNGDRDIYRERERKWRYIQREVKLSL